MISWPNPKDGHRPMFIDARSKPAAEKGLRQRIVWSLQGDPPTRRLGHTSDEVYCLIQKLKNTWHIAFGINGNVIGLQHPERNLISFSCIAWRSVVALKYDIKSYAERDNNIKYLYVNGVIVWLQQKCHKLKVHIEQFVQQF